MVEQKNEVFSHGVLFHKIIGVWPEDDQLLGRFSRVKNYGVTSLVIGVCCFQLAALMGETDNMNILDYVIEVIVSLTASVKVVLLVYNRSNVLKIVYMTQKLNISVDVTASEREISIRWLQIQTKIIKACMRSYGCLLVFFLCVPMLKGKGLLIEGILPNVVYKPFWYEIVYGIQVVIVLLRSIGVVSTDLLSITFMCQLCKEFDVLKYSIIILSKSKMQNFSSIIARHAIALDYGGMICNTFSVMFLLQHTLIGIILGLIGIAVLNTKSSLLFLKLSLMGIIATFSMLLVCYVGEKITNASLEIADAVESSAIPAYLGDTFSIKLVYFTLFRAQKPLRLTVGNHGIMNLRFFSQTMNKVLSLFMIIKATMES